MNRRILTWGLYDFASFIVIANISLYLSQWIIVEHHVPDIWYAAITALSTTLLLLVGPILGIFADRTGKRMKLIIPLTIVTGLATMGIGIFGLSSLPFLTKLIILLVLGFTIQFAYQLILIFYDTMIPWLSSKEHYGSTSGIGDGIGILGYFAGLLISYPFINGTINFFGPPGRLQAFIPSGMAFLILTAPMLILFKDEKVRSQRVSVVNLRESWRNVKGLLKDKGLLAFLVAFYFISDAVLTAQTFFAVFFQQALGFSDKEKIIALALILGFSAPGAWIIGKFSDQIGPKRLLILTTFLLAVLFAAIPLLPAGPAIWITFIVLGTTWGGFYAVARAFLTHLSPPGRRNEVFSLYTIFRRFASVVGPLVWGITLLVLDGLPTATRYKLAIYPLVVLMVLGRWLLRKVPDVKVR